jgi:hypothetical protein
MKGRCRMKSPEEFIDTIYLGDRAFMCVLLDGWNSTIAVKVDVISRSRW